MLNTTFILWLAITYICVFTAMAVDFISGVRKARLAGIATRSRGYKMSCDKAVKYFLPMMCLSCIDIIAAIFFVAPFLTMAMGAFNIFCELMSVLETTREKQEIHQAAQTVRMVIDDEKPMVKAIIKHVITEIEKHYEEHTDEKN